ncbi:MAG: hypothetical protein QM722_07085 [Piscinibacter sp.]
MLGSSALSALIIADTSALPRRCGASQRFDVSSSCCGAQRWRGARVLAALVSAALGRVAMAAMAGMRAPGAS